MSGEAAWQRIHLTLSTDVPTNRRFLPLVEAVTRRPRLRRLYPFVSHCGLNFMLSFRTGGNALSEDSGLVAWPIATGRFQAVARDGRILGEGDAEYITDLLVREMSPPLYRWIFLLRSSFNRGAR